MLRVAAHGLTDEQARRPASASSRTIGGLIKHVAATEDSWVDTMLGQGGPFDPNDVSDYMEAFTLHPDETLAGMLARYDEVAKRTESVVAGIADLGQPVPVPKGVPWFPDDLDAWSVRWVLLHLIQETARHAGHADIVRESVDGGTAMPLMAAVEGWPATPWILPWEPNAEPAP